MRRLAVLTAAVLVFVGVGAGGASAQTTDAVSVARALIAAENAHDVPGAVALFSPGAIVVHATGVLVSTAEITAWQRELAAGNFHADISTPVAVTPEIVTFSGTVAFDPFRRLGISPLAATWQLIVQLGKVSTFEFAFTPAAAARLQAALAGAGAGATSTPAATSSGGGSAASGSATAARSLALTGADLTPAAVGGLSVVVGLMMLGLARRPARERGATG